MKRKKMNFDDVRALFMWDVYLGVDTNDADRTSNATHRGHKHNHQPARKPSVVMGKFFPVETPAQWRRAHMSKHH